MKGTRHSSRRHSPSDKPDFLGVVRDLVQAGAEVIQLIKHKEDPMHLIFQEGDVELLTALKKLECSFFPADDQFLEALKNAAKMRHLSMIRYLTQTTRPLKSQAVHDAIVSAADSGYKDIVEALIDLKVHMTFAQENPLVAASARGHAEIVELLLRTLQPDTEVLHDALEQAVCFIHPFDNRFRHPEHCKSQGQPVDTIRLLLDFGYKGMDRRLICSHLFTKAHRNGRSKTLDLLLSEGANPDTRNAAGKTMLYRVCKYRHADVDQVQVLLRRGADVNLEGGAYGTPLRVAARKGNEEIVAILLDAGADPNFCSLQYGTCLTAIMAQQWIDICNHKSRPFKKMNRGCCRCFARSLLEHGADVDAESGSSGTALQVAARTGNEEGVRMLLDWDADVNAESGESGNALRTARVALEKHRAENEENGDALLAPHERRKHEVEKKRWETIIQLLLDAGALDGGD